MILMPKITWKTVNIDLKLNGAIRKVYPKNKGYTIEWDMRNLRKGATKMFADLRTLNNEQLVVPKDETRDFTPRELYAGKDFIKSVINGRGSCGTEWTLKMEMEKDALAISHVRYHWFSGGDHTINHILKISKTSVFSSFSQDGESMGGPIYGGISNDPKCENAIANPLRKIIFRKIDRGWGKENWSFWLIANPEAYKVIKNATKDMAFIKVAHIEDERDITKVPNHALRLTLRLIDKVEKKKEEIDWINWD